MIDRSVAVPPSNMSDHLLQFLESRQGSGVTLQVEQSEFEEHKIVLAMRSAVFRGSMRETTTRHVRIHDMRASVFEAMLHFIYPKNSVLGSMEEAPTRCVRIRVFLTVSFFTEGGRFGRNFQKEF